MITHKQNNKSLTDEKSLIFDLQKGSIAAFDKIFSLYNKRVYNFCRRFHQSSDDAQETLQRVFIALWEQREKVIESNSIASYLFSLARYMVYQDFRQKVYKHGVFNHLIIRSVGLNESTKDEVLYNELLSFLESVRARLPKRQREIFKLSRFPGLTYRQIADQLSITENTVDTQIRRAIKFVRENYKSHYSFF